ncbi:Uncharacterised protein [Segatella copri]|nr:Uncharacterised protein [Segatella copri]
MCGISHSGSFFAFTAIHTVFQLNLLNIEIDANIITLILNQTR